MKIVVDRRGAARVRKGHPWVYRSDIISAHEVKPGSLALVCDSSGNHLGTALYSSASQIAVRMISDEEVPPEEFGSLLQRRLTAAFDLRQQVVCNSNACRLVFSEADFLPGLILDRYNDIISMQVLAQGMDGERVRELLLQEVVERFAPAGVVERVDERVRDLEQLPVRRSGLLCGSKTQTTFTMHGLRFHFDALSGQKTGAFLDQRENYTAAAQYAQGGDCLDVFCYQGGFALHLAPVSARVTGVDSSRPALEIAEGNATLNGLEVEWIEANAFDLLKDYAGAGREFDTIVLDPPAFAKSRRAVPAALRGYKELNLRALKMLRPNGLLVTCSCSYHVSEAEFLEMLAAAALDAHRHVRVLERRTQAKDHPVLLTVPETQYLKCVLALVD